MLLEKMVLIDLLDTELPQIFDVENEVLELLWWSVVRVYTLLLQRAQVLS